MLDNIYHIPSTTVLGDLQRDIIIVIVYIMQEKLRGLYEVLHIRIQLWNVS